MSDKNIQEQINILSKSRCEEILDWAEDNSWFDISFIESMYDKLEKGIDLTSNQVNAIKNIHERFIG